MFEIQSEATEKLMMELQDNSWISEVVVKALVEGVNLQAQMQLDL